MAASPFTQAVVSAMRRLYPECLADKSFDNTGLLLEAPFHSRRRQNNSVLLTIDLTRAVTEEAIVNKHSVIVAYHPIIFRGLKSITLEDTQQRSLLELAAAGISVYCPHTAVDTVPGGMADWLCDVVTGKLDAPEPEAHSADVRSLSSDTDVTTSEESSIRSDSTKPTSESADHDSSDPFTSPTPKQKAPLKRPNAAQRTYSKPAYPRPTSSFHAAVIPHTRKVITSSPASAIDSANSLTSSSRFTPENTGAGRCITFENVQPLTVLITRIAHAIGLPKGFSIAIPQSRQIEDMNIQTVGLCPGSGSSVLKNCQPPPDLIFTGELSHHEALAVTERGGCVVSLFHSNSERGYFWSEMRDELEAEVKKEWASVRSKISEVEKNGFSLQEVVDDDTVVVEISTRDRDPYGIVVLQESHVEGVEI